MTEDPPSEADSPAAAGRDQSTESELSSTTEHRPGLRAFRLTLAYDGANYCGWQHQPREPTVQAAVEAAVREITGEEFIRVHASSRTDTGVHALGQSAVFRTDRWNAKAENIPFALNTKLPEDIVARHAIEVPLTFHPLRDSTGKRYRYHIYCSRKADPLTRRSHWWVRRRMNVERMREAAAHLVGEHDFMSFQTTGSPRQTTVRHVRSLTIECQPHLDGTLYIMDIEANGFLYNMCRNIAGTLVQVAVGRESPDWIPRVLAAYDRRIAGATAPPQGLCLMEVLF